MFRNYISIAVFSLTLLFGQTAFAHSHECGERMQKMISSLHLDDAQKAKVKPILEQLKKTMKDDWTQMKALRMQLHQQMSADKMDQATVDSLIDKKVKLMGDMMKARVAAKYQINGLLNPKQKAKHLKMMQKWQKKMDARAEKCQKHMD